MTFELLVQQFWTYLPFVCQSTPHNKKRRQINVAWLLQDCSMHLFSISHSMGLNERFIPFYTPRNRSAVLIQ